MIRPMQIIEGILLVLLTVLVATMINQQIETHEKIEEIHELLTQTHQYLIESDIEIIEC